MVTGCGMVEKNPEAKTTERKDEILVKDEVKNENNSGEEIMTEEEMTEGISPETTAIEPVLDTEKQTETKKTTKKTETKKETQTTVPAVSEPVAIPETTGTTCAHQWGKEAFYYDIFKKMTFGCNGCGIALFEWAEDKNSVEHIENLYFHEPCPTDRFSEPCSGGGYHSESVTIGQCMHCSSSTNDPEGRVIYRQCMWTEMGKRCSQNTVLGEYEKVEFNQNHFMYYETCKCGKNDICQDGATGKGIVYGTKEVCIFCGIDKGN